MLYDMGLLTAKVAQKMDTGGLSVSILDSMNQP